MTEPDVSEEPEAPLRRLYPSNEALRNAFAFESEQALELCRQRGVPIPRIRLSTLERSNGPQDSAD
jgi:hypothetical protein